MKQEANTLENERGHIVEAEKSLSKKMRVWLLVFLGKGFHNLA